VLRGQLGISGAPVALYVGRLVGVKSVDTLLRAFQGVQRLLPDAGLAIVGDGPLRGSLQGMAGALGLRHVTWGGFVQPADLARYYAAADLFALPSYDEPWGVVVMEAMACGLPVVLSERVGCARDLVAAGENGSVVPWNETNAWSTALATILADARLRRKMGACSWDKVRQWDYDFCIRNLREALAVAVGSRGCRVEDVPRAWTARVGERSERA
jgi:phosphatidylinositol alpha-1,6-mannosyltransferase